MYDLGQTTCVFFICTSHGKVGLIISRSYKCYNKNYGETFTVLNVVLFIRTVRDYKK